MSQQPPGGPSDPDRPPAGPSFDPPTQPYPEQHGQPQYGQPQYGQPQYGQQQPYAGQQQPYPGQQQPYAGQQQPYAGQPGGSGGGRKVVWIVLGVIGVVMVLVIGGCTALVLVARSAANDAQDSAQEFLDELESASPTLPEVSPSGPPTPSDPGTPEPPDPGGAAQALGTPAEIGQYTVTVTEVVPDATATYADGPPPANGQYAQITAEVTNNGPEQFFLELALIMGLEGGDGQEYLTSACAAGPLGQQGPQPLEPGVPTTVTACVDVPAAALQGGSVFAAELLDFGGGSRQTWAF